jgi:hypothetical protein
LLTDEDDKNNLVRDGVAAEPGADNIADNANATIVDEGYLFYNGMYIINLLCSNTQS